LVAQAEGQTGNICIPDVKLWEVHDAYLYKFVVRLSVDDEIIDEWFDYIGIRTISIDGTDILLNGKPVYLKGFGKHEDSDIAGRGFSLPVLKRDFELMKWIGANSFRTSHYPYSEETYYLADREGFLIIDEVAAVGFMASFANFLGQMGKRDCFFEKKTTPRLLDNHLQAVRELILRDKNHACVIAWSLFNEPESNHESAYPYFEKIFKESFLVPQKRPRILPWNVALDFASCHCRQLCDLITSIAIMAGTTVGSNIDDAERAFVERWRLEKTPGMTCLLC
jgi:beta-glucuronidase